MLTNSKIRDLVDRVAADDSLRSDLERDFDGTLSQRGIELPVRDRDALQAALHLIRQFSPRVQGATVMAGWGIGC